MPHGTILLVDDDRYTRESLAELLDDHGWTVDPYAGGMAAWERIRHAPESAALVVSDIDMPDISGFELLGRSREIHLQAPFILISARADDRLRDLARSHGASGLVAKPVAPAPFTTLVASLLGPESTAAPGADP